MHKVTKTKTLNEKFKNKASLISNYVRNKGCKNDATFR